MQSINQSILFCRKNQLHDHHKKLSVNKVIININKKKDDVTIYSRMPRMLSFSAPVKSSIELMLGYLLAQVVLRPQVFLLKRQWTDYGNGGLNLFKAANISANTITNGNMWSSRGPPRPRWQYISQAVKVVVVSDNNHFYSHMSTKDYISSLPRPVKPGLDIWMYFFSFFFSFTCFKAFF
jgi:hypothetical protein